MEKIWWREIGEVYEYLANGLPCPYVYEIFEIDWARDLLRAHDQFTADCMAEQMWAMNVGIA